MSPIQSNGGLTAGYSVVQATWDPLCAGLSFAGGESENSVLLDGCGLLAWVGMECHSGHCQHQGPSQETVAASMQACTCFLSRSHPSIPFLTSQLP